MVELGKTTNDPPYRIVRPFLVAVFILIFVGGFALMRVINPAAVSGNGVLSQILILIWILAIMSVPLAVLLLLGSSILVWGRVESRSLRPTMVSKALLQTLAVSALIPITGWLIWLLWAYGVIPIYEVALALAAILSLVLLVWGIRSARNSIIVAATPLAFAQDR